MKRKLFLCSLIGFFFAQCLPVGAEELADTYGGTGYDYAWAIQQTADGGYIVAGGTESFGAGNGDFWVLNLDASGNISWQKTYGGTAYDDVYAVQQTSDGGYIVAGGTESFGAGDSDMWVLKLDASGNISWQKTYGGTAYEEAYAVRQTSDGGYIVAGQTYSFGAGDSDMWVLKLDALGNVSWQHTYGGTSYDDAYAVQQTSDGGYIVAGDTESFGAGDSDMWVLKLDASGNISWQKTYGGTAYDETNAIQQTSDGGYIVAGGTESFGAGNGDFWVLKLDASGNISWQRTYGGIGYDNSFGARQTSDGGYIVAGDTESFGAGASDMWVLKLDASGNVSWQHTYGGIDSEFASDVRLASNGGVIVVGQTYSFGAGDSDSWVLKLDGTGNINECSAIGTSNVIPTGTNATVFAPTPEVASTSVASQDSSATVNSTSALNIQVCYAESTLIPLPAGQETFIYPGSVLPVRSSNPAQAQPIGIGTVAAGGDTLDIRIGTMGFSGTADVYFAVYSPLVLGGDILLYTGTAFVALSQAGLAPWMASTTGPVDQDLFGAIPISLLPSGVYTLFFAVAPAGSPLAAFYLWSAAFTVP